MKKLILILIFTLLSLQIADGLIDTPNYPMNATLTSYYSITISDQLAQGIWFTNLTGSQENLQYPLIAGSYDNNATFNYNKTYYKSEYWTHILGSVKIDICNGAKYNLCSNLTCSGFTNEEIGIGNVTWSSSTLNDIDNPSMAGSIPMILNYDNGNKISGINPGSYVYLRYWMDVPSNYPPYNYSTIYQIQAVPNGGTCV